MEFCHFSRIAFLSKLPLSVTVERLEKHKEIENEINELTFQPNSFAIKIALGFP